MEYRLSEQELKDLMHRSWLKAKNFYSGNTDEYFYDYFESEKKQLTIHSVVLQSEQLCIKCKKAQSNRGLGEHKLVCSDCWNSLCD